MRSRQLYCSGMATNDSAKKIYVIHENDAWVEPLRDAFSELALPYAEWFIDRGTLDLAATPPQGVFYNRMSASSHTRDHRYAAEMTGGVLAWLECHGRRVINNGRALQLEISKIAQYAALARHGIRVPRTIAAVGTRHIVEAARAMPGRFITKHNRAGKGLGVRLFGNVDALARHVESDDFEPSVDGITLIQEYIEAPEPFITRVEFVGGEFLYAVRVDTSLGFELCPADVCHVDDAFCPAGAAGQRQGPKGASASTAIGADTGSIAPRDFPKEAAGAAGQRQGPKGASASTAIGADTGSIAPRDFPKEAPGETTPAASAPRFRIVQGFAHPIVERYRRFLADNGIGIAGIEFIVDKRGDLYTYDVNTNTNYNSDAEQEAGLYGMCAIARYLGRELRAMDDIRKPEVAPA
jgi:hypothetical protein